MTHLHTVLTTGNLHSPTPSPTVPTPDYDDSVYISSEFALFIGVIIIVCFVLCLIVLNAASRCTWIHWFSNNVVPNHTNHFSLPATKLLRSIPKVTYSEETMSEKYLDCVICLSEYVVGDEIRVLPRCGHCFHVECIDKWIASHFTCPSCRQLLLKTTNRCDKCDEVPVGVDGVTMNGIRSTMIHGETSVAIERFIR
ncbi:RING-H2 finger protein ATL8-like [Rutidosis leptorrhynchoides]|uniref:RING-H2 finger protein ATL8-like n=1 Tax=Rutidosis leptorrhynchoides TaxID=125765 RepID=UPI003A99638E